MWIRLLPPFGDGKTWQEIALPPKATIKELMDRLVEIHPDLHPYLRATVEETFHQFILLRDDHVLTANDLIEPDDRIVMVMPLTGG